MAMLVYQKVDFSTISGRSKVVVDVDTISWPITRELRHRILRSEHYTTVTWVDDRALGWLVGEGWMDFRGHEMPPKTNLGGGNSNIFYVHPDP